jgi:two-component system NtrC family sensor kinase
MADINKCIESTLNIVWNELKYNSNVVKEFGDLPPVECYPQQLNQVFMNLLINAGQAISDQGEIKIKTRAKNGYAEITFSDTGCGIPKEHLTKIFDPFFTTKAVGKGTGLGLHVSYNIIKRHLGTMEVSSRVGAGTTFTIQLPLQTKTVPDA